MASSDQKLPLKMEISDSKSRKGIKSSIASHEEREEDVNSSESSYDSDSSDPEYICSICSKTFSGFQPYKQHQMGSKHKKAVLQKKKVQKLLHKLKETDQESDDTGEYLLRIKKPFRVCKPCKKEFGDPDSYSAHLSSKTHKRKIMESSILNQVRENGEINTEMLKEIYKSKISRKDAIHDPTDDLVGDTEERLTSLKMKSESDTLTESDIFECKDCDKEFTGLVPYTQHLMSKVHAKKIEKKKILEKIKPEDRENDHKRENKAEKDISTLAIKDDVLICKLCSMSFSGPESAMMHLKSKGHTKKLEKKMRKLERKGKSAPRKSAEEYLDAKSTKCAADDEENAFKTNSSDKEELDVGESSSLGIKHKDSSNKLPLKVDTNSSSISSSDYEPEIDSKVTEIEQKHELSDSKYLEKNSSIKESISSESCDKNALGTSDSDQIHHQTQLPENIQEKIPSEVIGSYEKYKEYKKLITKSKEIEENLK